MNRQKGIAPILIVLLIAAAVGGYLIYQKQTKPSIVPQSVTQSSPSPVASSVATSSAETTNWKTYKDNNLSFKYPSEWSTSTRSIITANSPKIRLSVIPNDSTLMNECMEEKSTETKNALVVKKFKRVTVGAMCATSDSTAREIWIMKHETIYAPGVSYVYSSTESLQAETIFDQILSTLKFIDQNQADETSNSRLDGNTWKNYKNAGYRFSFNYPNKLTVNTDYTGPTIGGPITGDYAYLGTWADKSTITRSGTEAPFDGFAVYVVKNVNKSFSDYMNNEKQTWIKNYREYTNQEPSNPKEESIIIDRRNGVSLMGYTWSGLNVLYVPLSTNQVLVLAEGQQNSGSFDVTFKQILSTLKFQ